MNYVEQMQNNQFSMEAFLARKFTQKYIPPSERKKNEAKVLPTRAEVAKFTGKPQEEEERSGNSSVDGSVQVRGQVRGFNRLGSEGCQRGPAIAISVSVKRDLL